MDVDKLSQTVKVYSSADELVVLVPASVGNEDTPSPCGTLKVTLIEAEPSYHYNPKIWLQGSRYPEAVRSKAGPEQSPGAIWIVLSEPRYAIHGTPESSLVGNSGSHGCVRLTNCDAQRPAAMLAKGVPVNFNEKPRVALDPQFATSGLLRTTRPD